MDVRLRKLKIPVKQQQQFVNEEEEVEEAATPASRVFIHPKFYTVAFCILGVDKLIDVAALKQELCNTLAKHKRFHSILKIGKDGKEYWTKTGINIDDHVKVAELHSDLLQSPKFVEEYTAKLGDAEPLDPEKPLWEAHVLNHSWEDAAAVCIFRFHHAIGDGTSLMSLFLASTRQLENPELLPNIPGSSGSGKRSSGRFKLLAQTLRWSLLLLWHSVIEIWKFTQMNLWRSDSQTRLRGQPGCESWPLALSIASLSLEDMKAVKRAASATINDVLLAITSMAIRRYLEHHRMNSDDGNQRAQKTESLRVRSLILRNTRPAPGLQEVADMMKGVSKARWGNNMGYMLIPLTMNNFADPLEHVRRAKACSARKKHSLEANFTYTSGAFLVNLFGPKVGVDITYRSTLQTTLTMSNIMGPMEVVTFAGNPIRSMVTCAPGLPQGLVMHMTSYNGRVKIALMVKKAIVPDADFLAKCFECALDELKEAAATA